MIGGLQGVLLAAILLGCQIDSQSSPQAGSGDEPTYVLRSGPLLSPRIGGPGAWADLEIQAVDYLSATDPRALEVEWEGQTLSPVYLSTRPLDAPKWDVLILLTPNAENEPALRGKAETCARRMLERNLDVQFILADPARQGRELNPVLEDLLFSTDPTVLRSRAIDPVDMARIAWRRKALRLLIHSQPIVPGQIPPVQPHHQITLDACVADQLPAEIGKSAVRRYLISIAFPAPDIEEGAPVRYGKIRYRGEDITLAVKRENRLLTEQVLTEAEMASISVFKKHLGITRESLEHLLSKSPIAGPASARLMRWTAGAPETIARAQVRPDGSIEPALSTRFGPLVLEIKRHQDRAHYYVVSRQGGQAQLQELELLADVEDRLAPTDAYRLLRQGVSAFAGPNNPIRDLGRKPY